MASIWNPKISFRNWISPYLRIIKGDISDEVSILQAQIDSLGQSNSVVAEHHELLEHHKPTNTGDMFIEVKDPINAHIQYVHLFMPVLISNKQFSLCIQTIEGIRKTNLK